MRTLLLISLISYALSSFGAIGGWRRDSFAKNSIYIDRSRSLGEEGIRSNFNINGDDFIVYPLEIYKQLVNGFNYKTIFAFFDSVHNSVQVFTSVVYTGPFSRKTPSFQLMNVDKVQSTEVPSNDAELISKVDKAIKGYLKKNDVDDVHIVKTFMNPMGKKTNVHVVKSGEKGQFVVFEDDNGNISVDAYININKN